MSLTAEDKFDITQLCFRYVVANLVIEGDGDQATATSYLVVFDREKAGVLAAAIYEDVLRTIGGV